MSFDVSIVPCGSYDMGEVRAALSAALAPLGGLDWVRPGMKIAVKVNLISAMRPDAAATVHPALLTALTELLQERGASVVLGSKDCCCKVFYNTYPSNWADLMEEN